MKHVSGCVICGADLVYLAQEELQTCVFCGRQIEANARCTQGHFVCDECHRAEAADMIERFCCETQLIDPMEIAITLMHHPAMAMHGPEHHFLVPAALLAAYENRYPSGNRVKRIGQARKRADGVRGGSCGFCGNCGAAVGTGIFISLVTGASPLSKQEWKLSNQMTAQSLLAVAEHGGPRCCKRDTYLAIQSAQRFLPERLGQSIGEPGAVSCTFSRFNKECLHEECPFFQPG